MSKKRTPNPLPISIAQQQILQKAPNISLVGLMGSGKSTVGRILAATLKRPFYDSDDEIVERTGATIPMIFEIEGEVGFRARESKVISDLSQKQNIILATGGGAVLAEPNREALKANTWVVYLSTTPERLIVRTRFDRNRPLLQNTNPLGTLQKMYGVRHPIYSELADFTIATGTGQVASVAMTVVQAILQRVAAEQGQV